MGANYLAIYLNDHLAGSTVGCELAKRAAQSNRGTEFGPVLERLHQEIVEDRDTLEDVMAKLGVSKDRLKSIAAYAGEKVGRLKLNGQLRGYSPLSRVVELEGLALGVTGKEALWKALATVEDPRLADFDFTALADRAERQQEELESLRLKAVGIAFEKSQPARTP
jgi:hypothetical protein